MSVKDIAAFLHKLADILDVIKVFIEEVAQALDSLSELRLRVTEWSTWRSPASWRRSHGSGEDY